MRARSSTFLYVDQLVVSPLTNHSENSCFLGKLPTLYGELHGDTYYTYVQKKSCNLAFEI